VTCRPEVNVTGGKAFGPALSYQLFCRDYLRRSRQELIPLAGEGIDVPFDLGGTVWTIDIALEVPDKKGIVVAECRWRRDPVKQEHVAAFAHKVTLLRARFPVVEAYFFCRSRYQKGAVRAAQSHAIVRAVCAENIPSSGFSVVFPGYDSTTGKPTQGVAVCPTPAATIATTGVEDIGAQAEHLTSATKYPDSNQPTNWQNKSKG
jgi:hypothetical protein